MSIEFGGDGIARIKHLNNFKRICAYAFAFFVKKG